MGKKLGLNQQKANFLHLQFYKIKNCAYMNKLLLNIFFAVVVVGKISAQDTLKTSITQLYGKDSQDSLMVEFQQFVKQMRQNEDLVFNSSNFPNHSAEVEKNCELYQLRWSYFCMPGGHTWVIKGDSTSLSFCQLAKETAKKGAMIGPYSGYTASPDGKYIVWGHSIPMGTCDDRYYYYERVDKK